MSQLPQPLPKTRKTTLATARKQRQRLCDREKSASVRGPDSPLTHRSPSPQTRRSHSPQTRRLQQPLTNVTPSAVQSRYQQHGYGQQSRQQSRDDYVEETQAQYIEDQFTERPETYAPETYGEQTYAPQTYARESHTYSTSPRDSHTMREDTDFGNLSDDEEVGHR